MLPRKIIKAINKKYPSIKESTLQKKYKLYLEAVTEAYSYAIMYHKDFYEAHEGQVQMELAELACRLGDFRINKKTTRVNKVFKDFCPLFTVTVEGNQFNKQLSQVALTKFGERVIKDDMKMVPMKEQNKYITQALAEINYYTVEDGLPLSDIRYLYTPIDISSLNGYIEKQTEKLMTCDFSEQLKTTIKGEILLAMNIKEVAEQNNNHLPQYISNSASSGRYYYKGLNLQNCPKMLRTAAIGKCIQYDINACSYAVMLNEAVNIAMERLSCKREEAEKLFSVVAAYVKDRNAERQQVGLNINTKIYELNKSDKYDTEIRQVKMAQIKQAFTAIGFGARAVDSCWHENGQFKKGALSVIFGSSVVTNIFLKDSVVEHFLAQVKDMNEIVYNYYEPINFEAVKGFPFIKSGKVSKSKALAHIYQSLEVNILKAILSGFGGNDPKMELYVLIHDGFITKKEMTSNQKYLLRDKIGNPYLNFSKEKYGKWQVEEQRSQEVIEFEAAHLKCRQAEEERALTYKPHGHYTSPVGDFKTDDQKKIKAQELANIAIREEVKRKSPGVDYKRPAKRVRSI